MAKCKRCGKEDLLLELDNNGLCQECASIVHQEIKQLLAEQEARIAKKEEEVSHQNRLLKIALKAEDDYYKDREIDKAIKTLEEVIVKAKPPLLGAIKPKSLLLRLYKQLGQTDKALELLTIFLSEDEKTGPSHHKARFEMAQILESEQKYSAAIEMYMLNYLSNIYGQMVFKDSEIWFREDIEPCVSKLKWDEETVSDLIKIVNETAKENSPAEAERIVTEQYRAYLNEHELGS